MPEPDMSLSDAKQRIQSILPAGVHLTPGQIWKGLGISQTNANKVLIADALLALKREKAIVWQNGKYMRA